MIAAIATAERMLAESGPSSITLNSVAREAGLSVGAIHQYLPDREAIYAALADRYHHRMQAALDSIGEDGGSAADILSEAFDAIIEVFNNEPNMRALTMHSVAPGDRDDEHRARMRDALNSLLVRVKAVHDNPEGRAASAVILAAIDSGLREAYMADPKGDALMIDATRFMATAWLNASLAATAATDEK